MTPLYIIPARGGSKGIPHKNIKPLGGKPLISYAIQTAKAISSDERHIILSTDSKEIADIARECGLTVEYMRPAYLATDTAGSREMMLDVMAWAENMRIDYDCVVLLQPTSPFRMIEDVSKCLEKYNDSIDMVVTVKETSVNPYFNCFEADSITGLLHISKGDGSYTRRQDAPKCYEYNGAVYVINPESLKKEVMGRFTKIVPVEMPNERSIDLDTPLDWLTAEILIKENSACPDGNQLKII